MPTTPVHAIYYADTNTPANDVVVSATEATSVENALIAMSLKQPKGVMSLVNLLTSTSASAADVNVGTATLTAGWASGTRLIAVTVAALSQGSVANVLRLVATPTGSYTLVPGSPTGPIYWQQNAVGAAGRGGVGFTYWCHVNAASNFSVDVLIRLNSGTGTVNLTNGTLQVVDLGGV